MEYSNDMKDIYKNFEKYNLGKKCEVLIVFDDLIADMINNRKLNPIVTELFIRGKKLKFLLFLLHNLFLNCRKMLDQIVHIFLL